MAYFNSFAFAATTTHTQGVNGPLSRIVALRSMFHIRAKVRCRPTCMLVFTGSSRSSPILTRCQREKLKLRLRLDHQVQFGEHHALFGSAESTGSWQDRVGMIWTADGWVADIEATVGEAFEFKYVTVSSDGQVIWERGPNRTLELPSQSGDFEVVSHWNQTQERIAFVARSSGAQEVTCDVSRNSDLRHTENSPDVGNGGFTSGQYVESTPFVQGWQGKETLFMKSNEHSGERLGQWDSMGLEAAAVKVVDGDRTASNWWRKVPVSLTSYAIRTSSLKFLPC